MEIAKMLNTTILACLLILTGCLGLSDDADGATSTNLEFRISALEQSNEHLSHMQIILVRHADLSYSHMTNMNLAGFDLSGANLSGADLTGTDLTSALLNGADLRYALLNGTNLSYAGLSGANLTDADLSSADLTGAYWDATTCPDGTDSDDNGDTCEDNLTLPY